jgi:hypothetical protein
MMVGISPFKGHGSPVATIRFNYRFLSPVTHLPALPVPQAEVRNAIVGLAGE